MKFIDFFIFVSSLIYPIILSIIHLIFYFLIKKTDFEIIFNTFESSPLFDFKINQSCNYNSNIIFHKWEGMKKGNYFNNYFQTDIYYQTDIEIINGYKFCFNHNQTYRDLLYNDQIIKENESCKKYYQSCGIIDTLNQKLCIKDYEKCPLKDIHFGQNSDLYSYSYDSIYNISYNNDNYKEEKKIIGNIILNHGQPCLSVLEKLWKKFYSKEAGDGHLKCKKKIKNMENDERYEDIGQISYKKLYKENFEYLYIEQKKLLKKINDEKVTLYKREFIGIDKKCDKKLNITRKSYEKLNKNQDRLKTLFIVEFLIYLLFHYLLYLLVMQMIFLEQMVIFMYPLLFCYFFI